MPLSAYSRSVLFIVGSKILEHVFAIRAQYKAKTSADAVLAASQSRLELHTVLFSASWFLY